MHRNIQVRSTEKEGVNLNSRNVPKIYKIRGGFLKIHPLFLLLDQYDYLLNNFFTVSEIAFPAARPANAFVATPITFPISAGDTAPT